MWIKMDRTPQSRFPRLNFVVSGSVAESIRDSAKSKAKMGRPVTTGPGQPQVVRMHDEQLEAIDAWIAEHGEMISRPEAIRRLVEIGLGARAKGDRPQKS
jgi:hypothetical protein